MKLGLLFTGGKDSCLAFHKALQEGHWVCCLLSVIPETQESFMFHTPDLKLLAKQAELLGIELIVKTSKGEKEKELSDLEELIKLAMEKRKIEGICVGGIASSYQGSRIKAICDTLCLKFYAPLWNYTAEQLWKELFDSRFKVIITKIACEGLPEEFIGKIIDKEIFEKLKTLSQKYKFRLDFEGGEAETAVLAMPEFRREIKIKFDVSSEGAYNHALTIRKIA